jgi:hypothetical protein
MILDALLGVATAGRGEPAAAWAEDNAPEVVPIDVDPSEKHPGRQLLRRRPAEVYHPEEPGDDQNHKEPGPPTAARAIVDPIRTCRRTH